MSRNGNAVEKGQFWRFVLEEHASSGLSVRAFCKRESLSESSFYSWRRKIRHSDSAETTSVFPNGLVPVDVIEQPTANHVLDIVVPGNVVVRIQEHCSTETLSRVLTAVRETFSC